MASSSSHVIVEDTTRPPELHVEPLEVSDDGEYMYLPLTSKYVESVLGCLHGSYYAHEEMCKLTQVMNQAAAREDVERAVKKCVEEGISYICVKKPDIPGRPRYVIGLVINRFEKRNDLFWYSLFYQCVHTFSKSYCKCRHLASRIDNLADTVDDPLLSTPAPEALDLHSQYNTEKAFTTVFLCTHFKFRRQGIAKKLMEYSIKCAQNLRNGINSRYKYDNKSQTLIKPGFFKGVFIGDAAKQLAEKLGFRKVEKPIDVMNWNLDSNIIHHCALYFMELKEQAKPKETEDRRLVEVHHSKDSPIGPAKRIPGSPLPVSPDNYDSGSENSQSEPGPSSSK